MAEVNSVFEELPTVHEKSQESIRSELNIFSLPPTDVSSVTSSDFVQFYPRMTITDDFSPLEFVIQTEATSYLDLANSFLKLSCRVVQQNGAHCVATDKAAPCQLFFHAMWKSVEIYLNGQLISDSSGFYPYIAYLNRILTTTEDQKKNILPDELYYPTSKPDDMTNDDGYKTRYALSKESGIFTMIGNIVANIFNQPRYLVGGTELRIVMRRNDPEFCLDGPDKTKTGFNGTPFKYVIEEAVFYGAKRVILPKIVAMHRTQRENGNTIKYPTNEYQVRSFGINSGLQQYTSDSLVLGKVPRMMVFGIVKSSSFLGDIQKSPFNFINADIREITLTYNGEPVEYRTLPLFFKPATAKGTDDILLALRSIRKTASNEVAGNAINRSNYSNGECSFNY